MPRSCCVKDCNNNAKANPSVKFYQLPKKKERRRKWLTAINRAETDESGKILNKTWSPKSIHQCYSQYKKHATIKVFISCTPLGSVNLLSKCWGGRASDIQIVRDSGFTTTRYHMPGEQILADRGFTLKQDFSLDSGSELIIPAFIIGKKQLPAKEIESTRKIAPVRIHIERVALQANTSP